MNPFKPAGRLMRLGVLILTMLATSATAGTLSGLVTDENNQPLSYASVYVQGTTTGTTTNDAGFYNLVLNAGEYDIVFQYIGYQKQIQHIQIGTDPLTLKITLKLEALELKEVIVQDGEDPAYRVIREAIKKRGYYLRQVDVFQCHVYIKGVVRLDSIPKKILGFNSKKAGLDTSNLGILYLSESESQYYFRQPDQIKEIMLSSKVSGDSRGFSWNKASQFDFNFYKNFSWSKFISPISETALLYYRYKLAGTFYEDGEWVNKILVIPKRRADPVFSGFIYITENTWRIHSTDLWLKKDANLDFLDSLEVKQSFAQVNDTVHMPLNQSIAFFANVLGVKLRGKFVGIFSDYLISPTLPEKFFNGEEWRVTEESNKKDSLYWESNRPIPLTAEETIDYRKKDSIFLKENSKAYLDSTDRQSNRFGVSNLILGYHYYHRYNKTNYRISGLLNFINYNTVEGFAPRVGLGFTKKWEDERKLILNSNVRYGFSNHLFSAKIDFSYLDQPLKFSVWTFGTGSYISQYNEGNPIQPLVNTAYTLLLKENYMKLYKNQFVQAGYTREVINGLKLGLETSYNHRSGLTNTTDYSWNNNPDREFTSNDPFNDSTGDPDPQMNYRAWLVKLSAEIRIKQRYITRPYQKIITSSKFPLISIHYTLGIPLLNSNANFNLAELQVSDGYKCGIFGRNNFSVEGGVFLTNENVGDADLKHFNGNQTIFASWNRMDSYQVLPYYEYSTHQHYVQTHYEQHFEGLLLNRIPLIKKLKWQEVAGFHYLYTPAINYAEVNIGVENIFKILRIDFVTSYSNTEHLKSGVVIGISSSLLEIQ